MKITTAAATGRQLADIGFLAPHLLVQRHGEVAAVERVDRAAR